VELGDARISACVDSVSDPYAFVDHEHSRAGPREQHRGRRPGAAGSDDHRVDFGGRPVRIMNQMNRRFARFARFARFVRAAWFTGGVVAGTGSRR
jgi:hypothetical protein